MPKIFLTYAHVDWDAPANREDVQGLVNGLEPQLHAELGHRNVEVWRDENGIRWGDDWREKLDDTVKSSAFMIVLLSPGWLKSRVCAWEYDTFRNSIADLERTDRILPISLRQVTDADLQDLTEKQRHRYNQLRAIQQQKWEHLAELDKRDLNRLLDLAAKTLKEVIQSRPDEPKPAPSQPKSPADETAPIDTEISPPVSGEYHMPSQSQNTCWLKLVSSGLASTETDEGTVIFETTGFAITTKVSGAKITAENPTFAQKWTGPIAAVTRIPAKPNETALLLERTDCVMRGEPLAGKGEGGHVYLFEYERDGEAPVEVTGEVRVMRQAVKIIDAPSDLTDKETEARDVMRKRLIDILRRDHIEPAINLQGATDDRPAGD